MREHGFLSNKKRSFNYNINEAGYNFRLSDLNCFRRKSNKKELILLEIKEINLQKYTTKYSIIMIVYYVHLGKKIEYQLIIYTILELASKI